MPKLNQELRDKIIFERREADGDNGETMVIISATHEGIYRQYAYMPQPHDIRGNPTDYELLEEEARNIVAMSIQTELAKR